MPASKEFPSSSNSSTLSESELWILDSPCRSPDCSSYPARVRRSSTDDRPIVFLPGAVFFRIAFFFGAAFFVAFDFFAATRFTLVVFLRVETFGRVFFLAFLTSAVYHSRRTSVDGVMGHSFRSPV